MAVSVENKVKKAITNYKTGKIFSDLIIVCCVYMIVSENQSRYSTLICPNCFLNLS